MTNSDSVVMASFDVTSLFTNIPVDETTEIISNQLFANCMYFEGFDRLQFTKLQSLAVKNCHFTFNDRIYQQIDGVAMGTHVKISQLAAGLQTSCQQVVFV